MTEAAVYHGSSEVEGTEVVLEAGLKYHKSASEEEC